MSKTYHFVKTIAYDIKADSLAEASEIIDGCDVDDVIMPGFSIRYAEPEYAGFTTDDIHDIPELNTETWGNNAEDALLSYLKGDAKKSDGSSCGDFTPSDAEEIGRELGKVFGSFGKAFVDAFAEVFQDSLD